MGLQTCFTDNSTQDVSAVDVCLSGWWEGLRDEVTVMKQSTNMKLVLRSLLLTSFCTLSSWSESKHSLRI